MDDYVKLFLINKFARKIENFWVDFGDLMRTNGIDAIENLIGFLNDNSGITGIPGSEYERIYELIKYNIENLINGSLTKDNFVNPPQKKFRINYSQDYSEHGRNFGYNYWQAADEDLALAFATYDEYNGDFDYNFDDRDVYDSDSQDFRFTDVEQISESIKKSIKKVLKEQYSIFIKKHN
jgi:hypothetical protein